jgi:hypothetical protein
MRRDRSRYHLGGKIDVSKFKDKKNATHEDILFAAQNPGDQSSNVWMHKDNREVLLIENYQPTDL